ncbi:MAG: hypothetical protein KDN18_22010 [Verrucomicrobiae bacterium]|nr:hypothetical protein [Verrucomicrobiae bacterium]
MAIEMALRRFYDLNGGVGLLSTGARVVPYAGVLYNVVGSTDDPDIDGASWKQLLIRNGSNGDCYVTDPLPDRAGTSHPGFDVGGHMTPNRDGQVARGETCYLMPLCKWHNSTQRDGTPFEHEETTMLELSGFMEGELAATFAARMPGDAEYRLVSVEGETLNSRALEAPMVDLFNVQRDTGVAAPGLPSTYLRFRRVEEGGVVRFVIDDARLPILG